MRLAVHTDCCVWITACSTLQSLNIQMTCEEKSNRSFSPESRTLISGANVFLPSPRLCRTEQEHTQLTVCELTAHYLWTCHKYRGRSNWESDWKKLRQMKLRWEVELQGVSLHSYSVHEPVARKVEMCFSQSILWLFSDLRCSLIHILYRSAGCCRTDDQIWNINEHLNDYSLDD